MRGLAYIMLLVLTACSVSVPDDTDPDVILAFQPVVSPMTKGDGLADLSVGVSAWTLDKDLDWIYGCEAGEYFRDSRVVPDSDDRWYLEDRIIWPSKNERLTVIGYAPYEAAESCCSVYGVKFVNVKVLEDQTDLLFTAPVADADKHSSGGLVTLPLQNALCKLDFKVRSRVGLSEKVEIKRIILDKASYEGDFRSLPQPEWNPSGEVEDVEFVEDIPRLMIPQRLNSTVTVEFEYTNAAGLSIMQSLKTSVIEKELKCGHHYTFILSVGVDDVKFLLEIL